MCQNLQENFKTSGGGGHHLISKIKTGDETYIMFFDAPTDEGSIKYGFLKMTSNQ